jgi:hypothetical protein
MKTTRKTMARAERGVTDSGGDEGVVWIELSVGGEGGSEERSGMVILLLVGRRTRVSL